MTTMAVGTGKCLENSHLLTFFWMQNYEQMVFFNALNPKHMGETTPENEGNVASHSRNSPHLTPGRLSRGGSLSKRQVSYMFINFHQLFGANCSGWWFQKCFIFTASWENDPI